MAATGWLLVYVASVTDDYGVFNADPDDLLHMAAPRRRDLSVEQVQEWMEEVEKAGLICRYESDRQMWGAMLLAPAKRTRNGKRAARFPHPEPQVAAWDDVTEQWVPPHIQDVSGASKTSKPPSPSSDNITKQSITKQSKAKQQAACSHAPLSGGADPRAALLERMGVPSSHKLHAAALASPCTSADLVALWATRRNESKNPDKPGPFIARIASGDGRGGVPKLTAKMVCEAVRAGVVASLGGGTKPVDSGARLTHNAQGLYVDGELVTPTGSIGGDVYA